MPARDAAASGWFPQGHSHTPNPRTSPTAETPNREVLVPVAKRKVHITEKHSCVGRGLLAVRVYIHNMLDIYISQYIRRDNNKNSNYYRKKRCP